MKQVGTYEGHNKNGGPNVLLSTKLYLPDFPRVHVSRNRLHKMLNQALYCKLAIVTSPPGFGKSTLVSDWIRSGQINAYWVSLDEGDNDLLRFWTYIIASLEKVHPGVSIIYASLQQPTLTFSIEQIITELINTLIEVSDDVMLILDDYHQIYSNEVHRSLSLFLQYLPIKIHICLISRSTPPLSIGTFRAKGQVTVIDMNEMKFTEEEITHYWLQQTDKPLSNSNLKVLAEQTEGWIAGIQLAILSLKSGQKEVLRHFNGNHRYIVDYLMEEVFQHLPELLKMFLMKTSILRRMNSDLCQAVTNQPDSRILLEQIEQANLFLLPLDNHSYWYRYHHLFADFLCHRLMTYLPEEYQSLHEKACHWYVNQGYTEEAIQHALCAENYELAVELIQSLVTPLLKRREVTTMYRWLQQLPKSIAERPDLLIIQVWTNILIGKYEKVSNIIEKIYFSMDELAQTNPLLFIRIREEVNALEILNALLKGDYQAATTLMEQLSLRENIPDREEHPVLLDNGIEQNFGELPFIRGYIGLNGRINQALAFHMLYNTFIHKNYLYEAAFVAYHRAAHCEIYYEKNNDEKALELADSAIILAEKYSLAGAYVPAMIIKSKIEWNQDTNRAIEILHKAMNVVNKIKNTPAYWSQLLSAQLVRYQLVMKDSKSVESWGLSNKFSEETELLYNREFELITYILAMIDKGNMEEASSITNQLLEKSIQSGRVMTELECHVCMAEIYRKKNNDYHSMNHLHQALKIGEQYGYLRIFLEPGYNPIPLFQQYIEVRMKRAQPDLLSGVSKQFLSNVVAIMEGQHKLQKEKTSLGTIHTLTKRELEILQIIAKGYSNKEIAAYLSISEGTVKTHLNRIYSKLDAKGRLEAIRKAQKRKLLTNSEL